MKKLVSRVAWAGIVLAVLCMLAPVAEAGSPNITTKRVYGPTGLSNPIFVTAAPGDNERILVVEKTGRLRWVFPINSSNPAEHVVALNLRNETGANQSFNPFSLSDERGVFSAAFHPDFQNNRFLYVHYVNTSGSSRINRYTVSASDPYNIDPATRATILTQSQPFSNHNGGQIAFSPNDGYLYIGLGDGGSGNDPGNRSQTPTTLLGKILRIDVDGGSPYAIPSDNPFVLDPGTLDEIWALGARNPWRFSFDRANGALMIADVGQVTQEEINYVSGASVGGENYGWRLREGSIATPGVGGPPPSGNVNPIHTYGRGSGCSITGGYVYRGSAIPSLHGSAFWADWCSDRIWTGTPSVGGMSDVADRTAALTPNVGSIRDISSFGEDNQGEIYITDLGGNEVFQVISSETPNVSITMTPQSGTVSQGTNLLFDVVVQNNTAQNQTFDGWLEAALSNGTSANQNPIEGPRSVTLGPSQKICVTARVRIPNNAPQQRFFLRLNIGDFGTQKIDQTDAFVFVIQ